MASVSPAEYEQLPDKGKPEFQATQSLGGVTSSHSNKTSSEASRENPEWVRKDFRPCILRTGSLILLLLATLSLIALIEVSTKQLPAKTGSESTLKFQKRHDKSTILFSVVGTTTSKFGSGGPPSSSYLQLISVSILAGSGLPATSAGEAVAPPTSAIPGAIHSTKSSFNQATVVPTAGATSSPTASNTSPMITSPISPGVFQTQASVVIPPGTILSASTGSAITPNTHLTASMVSSLSPGAYLHTPTPSAVPTSAYISSQPTFTKADYFIGSYLTTFLAVVYKSWWNVFYAAIKLVAPFAELARPEGVTAEKFLGIYYLSSNTRSVSIRSFLDGHWMVFWTSVTLLVTGIMAPIASEVIRIDLSNGCALEEGSARCPPRLAINLTVARALEGLLAFAAGMITLLWSMQRRNHTGVWSDPSRISTMASLLHHPDVVQDFQSIDPNSTEEELLRQLSGQKYSFAHYMTSTGSTRYGLVKVDNEDCKPKQLRHLPVRQSLEHRSEQPKKNMSRSSAIVDFVFAFVLLGVVGLVAAYYGDNNIDDGFNKWMSSQKFGPRFLMTFLGLLIETGWKRIEREVRIHTIYRRLNQGPCAAEDSILLSTTSHPLITVPYALRHGSLFLAWTSFVSFLSELLIIALGSVPFHEAELYVAYLTSIYTSVGILASIFVSLIAVNIWRRKNPRLPREPTTLGSVWTYLCGSKMIESFASLSVLSGDKMDKEIRSMDQSYILDYVQGIDGAERWAIDGIDVDH